MEFPLFRWHTASSAGSYRLQVSNSASFTTFIYDQPGLTDTFATVQNVPVYKWLYWRVNATNGIGTGAWSSARMVMVSPVSARPDHLSVRLKGLSIGRSIIRYDLPSATRVSVTLHDLRGRLVRKVAVGPQFAGSHQVALDPGNRLSGQFLLTFQAGNHTERRVIALIR